MCSALTQLRKLNFMFYETCFVASVSSVGEHGARLVGICCARGIIFSSGCKVTHRHDL